MKFETFVRAVLDTHFSETKDEIKESAAKAICNYTGHPIIKNEGKTIQFPKPKFKDEEEIKVGDEVMHQHENGIITSIHDGYYRILLSDGFPVSEPISGFVKTGRHFDELQQLLDKMKGEN